MTSRRSSRKSGGHRKHSDGGFSDTSSGGSFLDETDREVSNLTDRAFRSLCIGDEAIYNDSDLGTSSPCGQRDRQLAFSNNCTERDRQREELKRATHESFSLRMQQWGPDWTHGERYVGESDSVPHWDVYGERTQGRVSATFQQSFVEMSQPARSFDVDQTSLYSNGTNDLRSQQPRSHSRVSSLIKAFNSDGQKDAFDGRYTEGSDDVIWDRSSLSRMQSEFSYQQNCGPFPPAGQFSLQDNSYFSASAAAAFTRSSHSKHSMVTQDNCNSNFFIHSEFSPFQVWRDYNRVAYQQREFSGFMQSSEYPQWCESKMYKELSLEAPTKSHQDRNKRHQRNNMQSNLPRTPVMSSVLQKASALEKRCESELAGNYPHWKTTKKTNKLPSQRPSTASPTTEMSRRVQDTISSVKALQQKIKMMAGQNTATEMLLNPQDFAFNNQDLMPYGYNGMTAAPNVVSNNTSTTPFNISELLTPNVQQVQNIHQYANSPQPVEHAPVRAESRGGTPDIRMSSYKSKGASLLFNLKDNRKRVKSTYSPKFKGFDSVEKNKQTQQPRDTVIDIPEFLEPENQESNWRDDPLYPHENQYHGHMSYSGTNHQVATTQSGQSLDYPSSAHGTALMQGEVVHPSGFTGFTLENYTSNQMANHQDPHYDPSLFTPYKQSEREEAVGGHFYRNNQRHEASQLNTEDNLMSTFPARLEESQQYLNDKDNKRIDRYHDSNGKLLSDEQWGQTQVTEKLKFTSSPGEEVLSTLQENKKEEVCLVKEGYVDTEIHKSTDPELNTKATIHVPDNKAMLKQETGYRKPRSPYMKTHSVQPKKTTEQSNCMEDNSLSMPATDKQVKEGEPSDVTTEPIKQHTQARLASGQTRAQAEQPRAESAKLILAGVTGSETVEAPLSEQGQTHAKAEFKMADDVRTGQNETKEKSRRKQMEVLKDKEPLPSREEHTQAEESGQIVKKDEMRKVIEEAHKDNSGQDNVTQAKEEADKQPTGEVSTQIQPKLLPKANALQVVDQGIKSKLIGEQTEKLNLISQNNTQRVAKEQIEGAKLGTSSTDSTVEQIEETKMVQLRMKQVKTVEEKARVVEAGINTSSVQDKKTESFLDEEVINTNESKPENNLSKQGNVEVRTNHCNFEQTKTDLSKEIKMTVSSEKGVNSNPKNIQLVKAELAKTKAEWETIRKGQKEKVKKANVAKKDTSLGFNHNHSENKEATEQAHQQLRRYGRDQVDRGADYYESLREKYGFIDPISPVRKKVPPTGHDSPIHENVPPISEPIKDEKVGEQKSKDQNNTLIQSSKTENSNEIRKLQTNEDTDNLYIYSESSKEFRIGDHFCSNSHEQTTKDSLADKVKDSREEKHNHVSHLSDSECTKLTEGKSKSSERVVLHKSQQSAKVPKQRERALTKQEILTSKIKAHAEKEISAIKEKGFAKNPSKHFPSSHYQNVKQTPPSKEMLEKQESNLIGSNSDHLKEQSSFVLSSQATTMDTAQKHVPKGSFNRPETHKEEKETIPVSTDACLIDPQRKEMDSEAMSLMLKNKLEPERKEQTEESKDGADEMNNSTEIHNNNTILQDAYKPGGFGKDSALTIGQHETTDEDDHLQIMGVMVTVRENTRIGQEQTNSQEQSSTTKPDPDKFLAVNEKGNLRDLKKTQDFNSVTDENNQNSSSTEAKKNNDTMDVAQSAQQLSLAEKVTKTLKVDSKHTPCPVNKTMKETKDIHENENIHSNRKEKGATSSEEHKLQTEMITGEVTAKVATEGVNYKEDRDTRESHASVKEDITLTINQPKSSKDKTSCPQEERQCTAPEIQSNDSVENNASPRVQMKKMEGENSNEDDVHIDSIAIRVVSSVVQNIPEKNNPISNQLSVRTDEQRLAQSDSKEKLKTPDKDGISLSKGLKDKSEEDMGVERVLSSIRKLADSLKQTQQANQHGRINGGHDQAQARPEEVQNAVKTKMVEQDYFQIEGLKDASTVPFDSNTVSMSNDVSKGREVPMNDVIQEGKGFVKRAESCSPSNQNDKTKSQNREEVCNKSFKQTEMDGGQGTHVWKRHTESRPTSRERQRHGNRMTQQKVEHSVKEEPEIQSKPKRAAAIPEISALADYARLKVIVSEEPEDTFPDVPPNKKEGFFPLIQSRRSRCPNFTDQEDHLMKEKVVATKAEVSPNVNKEPKPVVFPITEKAHQRTGMFKLGEKEKTELEIKNKPGVLENVVKQEPTENVAQRGDTLKAGVQDEKAVDRVVQTFSPKDKPAIISPSQPSDVSKPEDSTLNRKMDECLTKRDDEATKIREYNSNTNIGRDISGNLQVKTKEEPQNAAKQIDEKKEVSQDVRVKNLIEESKAILIEEQHRAAKREQERRAREREAIAAAIKDRRQKQREEEKQVAEQLKQGVMATKHSHEERRTTRVQEEEEVKAKLKAVEGRLDVEERKMTQKQEEQRREAQVMEQHQAKSNQNKTTQEAEKTTAENTQQNPKEKEHIMKTSQDLMQDKENILVAKEKPIEGQEEQTKGRRNEETTTQNEKSSAQRIDNNVVIQKGEERPSREAPPKHEAQLADALQYYAITSTEPQRKPRGRQQPSPTPFQQRKHPPEPNDEAYTSSHKEDFSRSHRPRASPSPVPSLPRSNTTSPALGAKPSMFRVKDNTNRGSSLTKSVKPRFHKNFGEDFRVGSPMELIDEEQQRKRYNADTPINSGTSTALNAIQESSSSQGYSAPLRHNRPYCRRSIAFDEDDSRSVISNMSEDVESIATSAVDLADIRGLYDYERPESSCSFSSDVSRTMGKPPLVPPKSDKALRRAQRLTTHRIKKELSKGATSTSVPIATLPSSTEVCSSNNQAVASRHCSAPVSLTHAPIPGSSLPSFQSDHQSSHHAVPATDSSAKIPSAIDSHPVALPHASGPISRPLTLPLATSAVPIPVPSPHATDPVFLPASSRHKIAPYSLPMTSPHANIPVSLPVTSPHANAPASMPTAPLHAATPVSLLVPSPYTKTPVHLPVSAPHMAAHISIPHGSNDSGFISQPTTPTIVSHVPSSPKLYHPNYAAPVTQYHVESSYAHSYPLTQRRVMQDIGSGQYFIVDAPVQVKMKTFFDPETGKYVQFNVRESGQGMSRHQPQHVYPHPPLQPMKQVNPQQPINPPATKGHMHYEGYKSHHQEYQPTGVPKRSSSGMSVPLSLPHEQQFVSSDTYNYQSLENGEQCDSPEQTPYMDTVNEKLKSLNTVYRQENVHESPEDNTNGQESEPTTDLRCQPLNIIPMSELEDFMEISDW